VREKRERESKEKTCYVIKRATWEGDILGRGGELICSKSYDYSNLKEGKDNICDD